MRPGEVSRLRALRHEGFPTLDWEGPVKRGLALVAAVAALWPISHVRAASAVTRPVCGSLSYTARLTGPGDRPIYVCTPSTVQLGQRGWSQLVLHGPERVWLHQEYPNRGWAVCFDWENRTVPVWNVAEGLGLNAGDMQLTANTQPCPNGPISLA